MKDFSGEIYFDNIIFERNNIASILYFSNSTNIKIVSNEFINNFGIFGAAIYYIFIDKYGTQFFIFLIFSV